MLREELLEAFKTYGIKTPTGELICELLNFAFIAGHKDGVKKLGEAMMKSAGRED